MTNQETGKAGESSAAKYLKKKGYKVLERNYRNPFGEIRSEEHTSELQSRT